MNNSSKSNFSSSRMLINCGLTVFIVICVAFLFFKRWMSDDIYTGVVVIGAIIGGIASELSMSGISKQELRSRNLMNFCKTGFIVSLVFVTFFSEIEPAVTRIFYLVLALTLVLAVAKTVGSGVYFLSDRLVNKEK
jgi:cytochrome bd-type quinol oxidase subunit 1